MGAMTIWTIGHSNRSAGEFIEVLRAHAIDVLADVRRFPGSRKHPQFGGDVLAGALAQCGIESVWIPALGGRRREPSGPLQEGWRNPSFRSYAAYTWTDEFARGLEQLLCVAAGARTAMMCSELLWWRCHRALISDVLRFLGIEVIHLAGRGPGTVHPYTSPARIVGGELAYPAEAWSSRHAGASLARLSRAAAP